jgi:transcriptional regulator with XRE-family HTH domain
MQNVQIITARISELAEYKGVTLNKALTESGAGKDFMVNMERKNTTPSIDKIVLLADYFDVSVDYLLGRTESNATQNSYNIKEVSNSTLQNIAMGPNAKVNVNESDNGAKKRDDTSEWDVVPAFDEKNHPYVKSCPHCGNIFASHTDYFHSTRIAFDKVFTKEEFKTAFINKTQEYNDFRRNSYIAIDIYRCSNYECNKHTVMITGIADSEDRESGYGDNSVQFHPLGDEGTIPTSVPEDVKKDYLEGTVILPFSLTAASALCRSCSEKMIIDFTGLSEKMTLEVRINKAAEMKFIDEEMKNMLHTVRKAGNNALHFEENKNVLIDVKDKNDVKLMLDFIRYLFEEWYRRQEIKTEYSLKLGGNPEP